MGKINRLKKLRLGFLIATLLVVAALFLTFYGRLIFKAATGGCAISLSAGTDYQVGSEYDVAVKLDTGGNKIVAVEVVLNYPANLLLLESDQKGTDWTIYGDPGSSAGTMDRLIGNPAGVNGTSSVLLTAKFKAIAAGQGSFSFSKAKTGNDNNEEISTTSSGATFTIGAASTPTPDGRGTTPSPSPTPIVSPTSTATEQATSTPEPGTTSPEQISQVIPTPQPSITPSVTPSIKTASPTPQPTATPSPKKSPSPRGFSNSNWVFYLGIPQVVTLTGGLIWLKRRKK